MARQIRRKGLVIVISDFFDDEQKVLDGISTCASATKSSSSMSWTLYELVSIHRGGEFEGLEQIPKILAPRGTAQSYLPKSAFRLRIRDGCERNNCHTPW